MDKHTQGEWKLNPLPNPNKPRYYCLYTKEGGPETINHIATIPDTGLINKNEMHTNAKLISAAPAMLEALRTLKEDILHAEQNGVTKEGLNEMFSTAREAIKKATE